MEQKSVEQAKRAVSKLGSYTTKIKRELKKLPGMMQQQMNHKHGAQIMKDMLDTVQAMGVVIQSALDESVLADSASETSGSPSGIERIP